MLFNLSAQSYTPPTPKKVPIDTDNGSETSHPLSAYDPSLSDKHYWDQREIVDDITLGIDPDVPLWTPLCSFEVYNRSLNEEWVVQLDQLVLLFRYFGLPFDLTVRYYEEYTRSFEEGSFLEVVSKFGCDKTVEVAVDDCVLEDLIRSYGAVGQTGALNFLVQCGLNIDMCMVQNAKILVDYHNMWVAKEKEREPDSEYYHIVSTLIDLYASISNLYIDLPESNRLLLEEKFSRCNLYYFDSTGIAKRLTKLSHHTGFTAKDIPSYIRESKHLNAILKNDWGTYSSLREYCIANNFVELRDKCHNGSKDMHIWFIEDRWRSQTLILELRIKQTGELTLELTLLHYLGNDIEAKRALNLMKFRSVKQKLDQVGRFVFDEEEIEHIVVTPVGHNAVFPMQNIRYRDWNHRVPDKRKNQILGDKVFISWDDGQ